MNRITTSAIAASLAFSAPVFADDAHHPEKAAEAGVAPAQPAAQQVRKMQDNVKKMQAQLDRVAKAKTDAERQTAMAEHMATMQENMGMARAMQAGMMGCPMTEGGMMGKGGMGMMGKGGGMGMMGGGPMAGGMGGGMGMMGGGAPAAGAEDRVQQMEKRMDMMQMMMQQMMMSRSNGMVPAPAPAK